MWLVRAIQRQEDRSHVRKAILIQEIFYGLNVGILPQIKLEPSNQCNRIKRWGFGKLIKSQGSAFTNGISALIKETLGSTGAGAQCSPSLCKALGLILSGT